MSEDIATRWRQPVARALLVGVVLASLHLVGPVHPADARVYSYTQLPVDGFRSMVVDAERERVYISSAESGAISVVDLRGRVVGLVEDLPGASEMVLLGQQLFVALELEEGNEIAVLDAAAMTLMRRLPLQSVGSISSLAHAGGRLWTIDETQHFPLVGIDPVTGQTSFHETPYINDGLVAAIPSTPDQLFAVDGNTPQMAVWDVSGETPQLVESRDPQSPRYAQDVAISQGGERAFVAAWGSSGEVNVPGLDPSGVSYGFSLIDSVAYTEQRGGLLAFGSSALYGHDVAVYRQNRPDQLLFTVDLGEPQGQLFDRAVAFSPDGSVLFAAVGTGDPYNGRGPARLYRFPTDALRVAGTGFNYFGGVGDSTRVDRAQPVPSYGMSDALQVSTGLGHSVALKQDGSVWTWGYNGYGQLGYESHPDRVTPTKVEALLRGYSGASAGGATSVAAGFFHTLALDEAGRVWSWGSNGLGQLGTGEQGVRTNPKIVSIPALIVDISAGAYHSLALDSEGKVWAWGWNAYGQLGDGTTADRHIPVEVKRLSGIRHISAGGAHSVASQGAGGGVYGWGMNAFGQLGDGTSKDRLVPVRATGLANVTDISAGYAHSLAADQDGRAYSWGWNGFGQLGAGSVSHRTVPGRIGLAGAVDEVSAGLLHSAGISDRQVWAWGWNGLGQLGDGTTADRFDPVLTKGVPQAHSIAAGAYHSLIVYRKGQ